MVVGRAAASCRHPAAIAPPTHGALTHNSTYGTWDAAGARVRGGRTDWSWTLAAQTRWGGKEQGTEDRGRQRGDGGNARKETGGGTGGCNNQDEERASVEGGLHLS